MKRTNRTLEASIEKNVAILDPIHRAMCTCAGLPSNFVYSESDEDSVSIFLNSMKIVFEREVGKLDSDELQPFTFEIVILSIFQYLNRLKESESTRQDKLVDSDDGGEQKNETIPILEEDKLKESESTRQDKLVDSDDDGEQKNETIPTLEEDQHRILFLGIEYIKVFSTIINANSPAASVGVKEVPKKLRKLKSDLDMIKEELKKLMSGSDFREYIKQLAETLRKTKVTERRHIKSVIADKISQFNELYKDEDKNFVVSIDEMIEFLEKSSPKKEDGRRIFLVVFNKILKKMSQILCKAMPIRLLSVLNYCLNEGIEYKNPMFFYSIIQEKIGLDVTDALNNNDYASCVKVFRRIEAMIKDFDLASSNRGLLHKKILKHYDTMEKEVNNLRVHAESLRNKIGQLEREVKMEKKEVADTLNSNSYNKCSMMLQRIEAKIEDFSQGSSDRSPHKFQKRYRIFKGRVEILKEQAQSLREKMRELEVEEVVEEVSRRAVLPA